MAVVHEQSGMLKQLRRRVVVGNIIGYAGMAGVLLIFFSESPVNPLLYGLAGAAVGSGTGLAYLSLIRIRRLAGAAASSEESG